MRKNLFWCLIVGVFGAVFCGLLNSQGDSAALSVSATVNSFTTYCEDGTKANDVGYDCSQHDGMGGTDFTVSVSCGSDCTISDDFNCWGTHAQIEWTGDPDRIEVGDGVTSGGYTYYSVTLYKDGTDADGAEYQPVCGEVRKPSKKTLTAYAKRTGDEAALNGGNAIDSNKVNHGSTATVHSWTKYYPAGYTWAHWGSSHCGSTTNETCSETMDANYDVNAYYTRNHFKGAAKVTGADSSEVSTGYVDNDSTKNTTTKCGNGGCNNTFGVYLKTIAGGHGGTGFSTNTTASKSSPYTPSTSGEQVGSSSPVKLYPGTEACRYITFHPFGSYDNGTTKTAKACISANVTNFQGQTHVTASSGTLSGDTSTGYVSSDTTKNATIKGCSLTSGCNVTFKHDMKRTVAGEWGSSPYSIARTTNYTGSGITGVTSMQAGTFNSDSGQVKENTYKLYPGMKVCETVVFKKDNKMNNNGNYVNSNYVKATSCVTAEVTYYQGRAGVTGVGDTGYKNTDTALQSFYINNCSPTAGCTVNFKHDMKRSSGSAGNSAWSVVRTSNLHKTGTNADAVRGIDDSNVGSGTFTAAEATVKTDGAYTLYPGMVVCEKLTFKKSNSVVTDDGTAYVEACASAKGDAQPGDPGDPDTPDPNWPNGNTSFINIKVRNTASNVAAEYKNYRKVVYAKPGDVLEYQAAYWPVLQYTYKLTPQQMRVGNNGAIKTNSGTVPPGNSSSKTLGQMFNAYPVNPGWNNGFSIRLGIGTSATGNFGSGATLISDHTYTLGTTDKRAPGSNQYRKNSGGVQGTEVGKSIDEQAITNLGHNGDGKHSHAETRTTPKQVNFDCNPSCAVTGRNLGTVDNGAKSAMAQARVPYNFEMKAEVTTEDYNPENNSGEKIYAGEEATINYELDLNPKGNSATAADGSKYATRADNVKREIVVYTTPEKGEGTYGGNRATDVCGYFGVTNGDQTQCGVSGVVENSGSNVVANIENVDFTRGKQDISGEASFNVQDVSAGSRLCVAVAVFPANSGAATNWNDQEYSRSWYISPSKCFTVLKKPSLEVWGGNMFSNGAAEAGISVKNNLKDYTGYSVRQKNDKNYIFGSWTELGLISSGTVKGVFSGASVGYAINSESALKPDPFVSGPIGNTRTSVGDNPGGGNSAATNLMCNYSPMTIANKPCGETVGALGNSISTNSASEDKAEMIKSYVYGGNDTVVEDTLKALNDPGKLRDGNRYYYKKSSDLMVDAATTPVSAGTIQIIHAMGDITIKSNLLYDTSETYNSLEQVLDKRGIPKLIVYAEKNIIIDCGVTQIDAILVAEDRVITCNNYGGVSPDNQNEFEKQLRIHASDRINSTPLRINGAVVADVLVANRTYGAATGANSIIPAEIIDFDPSLYLWGGGGGTDSSGSSVNMDINYRKELAPRL